VKRIADVEDSLAETSESEAIQSDAFVFFGATGDLAYKKMFPSLYNLVLRGTLTIPVIGIAKSGWSLDQLQERARSSVLAQASRLDDVFFVKFMRQLNYIDGDYRDPATFSRLRQLLGSGRLR
jgi:glucose-6-phosphate 1-dehydrogenase